MFDPDDLAADPICLRLATAPRGHVSAAPLRVAVVGGGVTGLAAAYALERRAARPAGQPVQVTLLEASNRLGGKVRTEHIGRLLVEPGPDALFLRDPSALDLLGELGLASEVVHADARHRPSAVLQGGRLHHLPAGLEGGVPRAVWPLLRTGLLSPLGKLRAAAEIVLPPAPAGGDESVDGFVRRRFGPEVAERIAAPLLGSVYGGELSLAASAPHLRRWEREHGSLLRAALHGQPSGARAGTSGPSPFISLRGGLGSLVAALRQACPRTAVLLGASVTALAPAAGPASFELTLASGQRLPADRVILATPAFVAADLIQPLSPTAAAGLRDIRYASAIVVVLVFGAEAAASIPPGSGFLVAPGEPSLLAACSWSSHTWPHCAPDGELLVRCHLHPDGRPELAGLDDAALVEAVRAELRAVVGLRAAPVLARVYRWPRAIASYRVGHLERLQTIQAAVAKIPGLVLAGAGYRGAGLPECLRQGVAAAEEAVRDVPGRRRSVSGDRPWPATALRLGRSGDA